MKTYLRFTFTIFSIYFLCAILINKSFAQSKPTVQDIKNDFALSALDLSRRYSDAIDLAMRNSKVAADYADTLFRLRDSLAKAKTKK